MTPITDTQTEIDELRHLIAQGKSDTMAGLPVSLGELASRTERLCVHLTSGRGAASRTYLAALKELIDDIDVLAGEIKGRLGLISGAAGAAGPAGPTN